MLLGERCLANAAWLKTAWLDAAPSPWADGCLVAINAGGRHVGRRSACGPCGEHPIFPGRSDFARKSGIYDG